MPGGIETAILFFLFDQSVMNFNKPTSDNIAENSAIRAMVNHAKNDTVDHLARMKGGRNGLYKGTIAALRQLENVTQLPKQEELWDMLDPEIESRKEEIAEAIKHYEAHTWRDHDDLLLLREQGSLLANLVRKQQMQIRNLNDR